nr:U3 small nucleolar ribonucleoprotein protein MPP10 [Ipomoea batatas]
MDNDGEVALRQLKSSEPPLYLSPSPELLAAARLACKYLYSSLKPFTPKSPFEQLLTDGFDAEQIWQQIDLQSEPLLSSLRRRLEGVDLEDDISDVDGDMESARYEDFFARKTDHKGKRKPLDRSDHMEMDEEVSDDDNQGNQNLSTHEQELLKLRSTIEEMEKANIEPKAWTMQGEVTAAKRPKNSALEVDLDFEHNVRPAPVITEEVTLSLEELIRKRILEEQFDDVQKPPSLPSRAPREIKEVDDNKSKKGLAEVYEEEYVQKTGLVSTAMTFSDEQKKETCRAYSDICQKTINHQFGEKCEIGKDVSTFSYLNRAQATMLFKKLCLKLDALSHFHFTPKPVIEDMSIQASVPALAMEEIAPVATSDAAMLAPEEVFTGKGDIKEETELTQAERKRRRAKKKRKFKAEALNRKAPQNTSRTDSESEFYPFNHN